MKKTRVLSRVCSFLVATVLAVVVLTNSGAAEASPVGGRLGLGIINTFQGTGDGPTGLNLVYDGGAWHVDAALALAGINDDSQTNLGAHAWFHLREGSASDFSIGGGVGWYRFSPDGPDESSSSLGIDLGFQIRVFVTANVAVGARAGLLVLSGDGPDGFVLGGEPVGAFSLTYFF